MGHFLRYIALAIVFATQFLFIASSQAAPIEGVSRVPFGSYFDIGATAEGNDYFRADFSIPGNAPDGVLRRLTITDGSKTEIWRRPANDSYVLVTNVRAGGGVVAIEVRTYANVGGAVTSEVLRMNRDGTSITTIATGTLPHGEQFEGRRGSERPLDCGTTVELADVSPAGEVIVGENVRERTGRRCGASGNRNAWTYRGVALDGSTRTLFQTFAKPRFQFFRDRRGGTQMSGTFDDAGRRIVNVNGDWMTIGGDVANASLTHLPTGMRTALTGRVRRGYRRVAANADVNGEGTVIAGEFLVRSRAGSRRARPSSASNRWLFPAPVSMTTRRALPAGDFVQFCGDRAISVRTARRSRTTAIVTFKEFDRTTGDPSREIGTVAAKRFTFIAACTSTHAFLNEFSRDGRISNVLVVPLG